MTTEQRFEQAYRVLARGLLLRAPGFDRCGATLIDELVASGELARLATGDAVTRRGQRCDHLVLVVEGALEARISVSDGRRHLLAFVLPGLLIGFLSVIDGGEVHQGSAVLAGSAQGGRDGLGGEADVIEHLATGGVVEERARNPEGAHRNVDRVLAQGKGDL